MIPLSVPNLKGNESIYLKNCIDTEWVSSVGKYVNDFEFQIAKYTGTKYAVACSSGTAALQLSLIAVGVEPDDEVIVPTMTFIATPNSVSYLNANPVFLDCDKYLNIDIEKLETFFKEETYYKDGSTFNKLSNKKISAIIPVHVSGNAVDMESIVSICEHRNIKIVEDAAEAMGTKYLEGKYKNRHAGSIGLVGCLSFNGNKIITSGGGGMVITNDENIANKVKYLSTQANNDSLQYVHNEIGFNYRLTNIQAAVGVAQLEKLDDFVLKKNQINNYYKSELKSVDALKINPSPEYSSNNHWMTSIFLKNAFDEKLRDSIMNKLGEIGIQTRPMWHLCHLQKPYIKKQSYKIENALDIQMKTINIPSSTGISEEQLSEVVLKLKHLL
tara:strand:+ start:3747 stop:4904 length:1158 start_codon:yes stop_codon:yes gene_type:complete